MDIQTFIQNFREAFGEKAELPLVFWYSDTQEGKEAEDSPVGQGISGKHDGRRGIRKYEFCGIS